MLSMSIRNSVATIAVAMLGSFFAHVAHAQVADIWTNDRQAFVSKGKGVWHELQGGNTAFKFKESARGANHVVLFDGSRGITVSLFDGKADVSSGATQIMTLTGRFFFTQWVYADGKGMFVNSSGNKWQEFQNGKPVFSFLQSARTTNTVELYDASRGVNVSLIPGVANVSEMNEIRVGIPGQWSK